MERTAVGDVKLDECGSGGADPFFRLVVLADWGARWKISEARGCPAVTDDGGDESLETGVTTMIGEAGDATTDVEAELTADETGVVVSTTCRVAAAGDWTGETIGLVCSNTIALRM